MNPPALARDIKVTKLVTLTPQTPVLEGIARLLHSNISGAPVVDDDNRFLGVFSEKCCLRVLSAAAHSASTEDVGFRRLPRAREVMATDLVTLAPHVDAFEAIDLMLERRVSGAPVIDNRRLFLGLFSERSSMSVLLSAAYDQSPSSTVGAFMDPDRMCCISEDTDLLSMVQTFLDTPVRQLPVLRDGVLRGQVSRRDVLRAALSYHRDGAPRQAVASDGSLADGFRHPTGREQVNAYMDTSAGTVTEGVDTLSIAQIFRQTPYRRLPVLREGKLVGQISRRDLLQAVSESIAASPSREQTLLYLSALVGRQEAPF